MFFQNIELGETSTRLTPQYSPALRRVQSGSYRLNLVVSKGTIFRPGVISWST